MLFRYVLALFVALVISGCAVKPQNPIAFDSQKIISNSTRVGVVMTPMPVVDTRFPGADCLLCMAAASVANNALTTHVKTLPLEDLPLLKIEVVKSLKAKGLQVVDLDTPLDLSKFPDVRNSEPGFSKKDFSSLKSQHNIDKLLVLSIAAVGVHRNYSAYIPTGAPYSTVQGVGYIVNLNDNSLDWYEPVTIRKFAEQNWDEPPKFPGLTNAYYQAIEMAKDAFTRVFK